MEKNNKKSTGIFIRPIGLLIIIIASIFASVVFVDLVLAIFPRLSRENFAFFDAGLMSVILFPVIYYLVFDPLRSYIKELEEAGRALEVSEAKYRSLVETTDDSIYLVNRDCNYLFMNEKHRTRMGFFNDEYEGRAYGEFHSAEETRDFAEEVNKVFETRQSLQHEHRSQRDGMYFLRTLSPVKGPDREVFAISVVSKNVSKIKPPDIY